MVFAVQCPNVKCRKFMLVEEHQQGKIVPCLLCRAPIKIGVAAAPGKPREFSHPGTVAAGGSNTS